MKMKAIFLVSSVVLAAFGSSSGLKVISYNVQSRSLSRRSDAPPHRFERRPRGEVRPGCGRVRARTRRPQQGESNSAKPVLAASIVTSADDSSRENGRLQSQERATPVARAGDSSRESGRLQQKAQWIGNSAGFDLRQGFIPT